MQDRIITQGLELLLYGMATVVIFLTLLVLATGFTSWLLQRYFPEVQEATPERPQRAAETRLEPQLVAVIGAALQRHRARGRRTPGDSGPGSSR